MTLTIVDVADAVLDARAEVEDLFEEIVADFYRPQAELITLMRWYQIPGPVKEQLRKMDPSSFNQAEEEIKDIIERNGKVGRYASTRE